MPASKKKRTVKKKKRLDYSKKLISDIRSLLWIVTVGGLVLAFYCIHNGYSGSLPWITAMVGLPWTAHGTVCACYMNLCKSDHSEGGITFESAKANGFVESTFYDAGTPESPEI